MKNQKLAVETRMEDFGYEDSSAVHGGQPCSSLTDGRKAG